MIYYTFALSFSSYDKLLYRRTYKHKIKANYYYYHNKNYELMKTRFIKQTGNNWF
jgi:hypothetical protein